MTVFSPASMSVSVALLGLLASAAIASGPLTSGRVVAGTISAPSFSETWTLVGTQGDRVLFSAPPAMASLNTQMTLRDPGGGVVASTELDRMEAHLPVSGSFTLLVEDVGLDATGSYNLGFVNLTAGPLTSPIDPDGGAIASAQPRSATMNVRGDFDVYTFSGTAGDRVILVEISSVVDARLSLYAPGGGAAETIGLDRLDLQLASTGTYQVVVEDQNFDQTGLYTLSFLNLTAGPLSTPAEPDGGAIASGEVKTAGLQAIGDFDAYSFDGASGERVLIGGVRATGNIDTRVSVYPPGGGASLASTSADRVDVQLTAAGTYTVVIEDVDLDGTGTYSLALFNVTAGPLTSAADPDGGPISSGTIDVGSVDGPVDFDAYTFSGAAGDRVIVGAVRTSGAASLDFYLYPPDGGPAEVFTAGVRTDLALATTGTYTIVIHDRTLLLPGTYSLSMLNVTTGPYTSTLDTDSTTIYSAEYRTCQINAAGDFDAFRFSGVAGDQVIVAAIRTGTNTYLYPPDGSPAVAVSTNRLNHRLTMTGTYTIVVEDQGLSGTGSYVISMLNATAGPLTSPVDSDGGTIASAAVVAGTIQATGDFDAFTFTGSTGQRVIVICQELGAALLGILSVYGPSGAEALASGSASRVEVQLPEDGSYTIVIADDGVDAIGPYHVAMLNVTAGPLGTPQDPEGGVITSAEAVAGQATDFVDLDAFTFTGNPGDRVVIVAVPTSGPLFNPQIRLYPPGGGEPSPAVGRIDQQLASSGVYTVVIEDEGYDAEGSYSVLLLNVTSGPHSSPSDLDGGTIESAEPRVGQMNSSIDLDAFTFAGNSGDRILIGTHSEGEPPFAAVIRIYPPGGGIAEAFSSERLDAALGATGTYTIVVEDQGFDAIGSYVLSLLNVTAGPLTSEADPEGGTIGSAETREGLIGEVGDMDAYVFNGMAGQIVLCDLATSGIPFDARLYLYPPAGGAALVATSSDRFVAPLTAGSGAYTILVEDSGLDALGAYAMSFVNLTSGPFGTIQDPEGGALASGEVVDGQVQTATDFDVYTFTAGAADRVVVAGVATGVSGLNTRLSLYGPGGGLPLAFTSGDRLDQQLPASGTYAVLVEDEGRDQEGSYGLSLLNVLAGPLTSPADPDGGVIGLGESRDGQISTLPDLDGYWFFGNAGQTATIGVTATSGALNTNLYVYPPGGGPFAVSTSADQFDYVLTWTGKHCLLIEDLGLNDTGAYHLTLGGGVIGVPDPGVNRTRVVMLAPAPNPSAKVTTLAFTLPERRRVELRIYDVTGGLVRTLAEGPLDAGAHPYTWDGTTDQGATIRSGIYYAELTAGAEVLRKKLVRIR